MKRDLKSLDSDDYDVLVIGAGITGAWVALECVLRGLRTIVIDKNDFGSQTSSSSSRLLHGGIRYLQQLKFQKVIESAMERAYYQNAAPHLCNHLSFLIPTYRNFKKGRFYLGSGLALYEKLIRKQNQLIDLDDKKFQSGRYIDAQQLSEILPDMNPNITGAFVFQESQMPNSERMTLAVIESVMKCGGHALNYVKAAGFIRQDNSTCGAIIIDQLNGKTMRCRARVTVNACGPWINSVNNQIGIDNRLQPNTGYSQGSHIIVPRILADYALALPSGYSGNNALDRGGRHIFIIPWNNHSLIGTSYRTIGEDIDDLNLHDEEINQLIDTVNQHFPSICLNRKKIVHSFSGIYPLLATNIDKDIYQGSGEYKVIDHQQITGDPGLVSALGAKYTTARLMGEKVTDVLVAKLGKGKDSAQTRKFKLVSTPQDDLNAYTVTLQNTYKSTLDKNIISALIGKYGTNARRILAMCEKEKDLCRPLSSKLSDITAQLYYAVHDEMAVSLEDVMLRRTHLGIFDHNLQTTQNCANIMASLLDWDEEKKRSEIHRLIKKQFRHTLPHLD